MKKMVLTVLALMLVFAVAGCSKPTKLEITNVSAAYLVNISYGGDAFDNLPSGASDKQEVSAGVDYIFLNIAGNPYNWRTTSLVNCKSNKTTTFIFTGDTFVSRRSVGDGSRAVDGGAVTLGSLLK